MHTFGQNLNCNKIRSLDPEYWVKVKPQPDKHSIDCRYKLEGQTQIFKFKLSVIQRENHHYFVIDKPEQTSGLDYLQLNLAILKDKQCNKLFHRCRKTHLVTLASLGMPLTEIAFLSQFKKQDYPLIYLVILTMAPAPIALEPDTLITKELLSNCLGGKLSSGQLRWLRKIIFPDVFNPDYITCVKTAVRYAINHWDSLPLPVYHEKMFRAEAFLIYIRVYQLIPDLAGSWNKFSLFRAQQLNFTHNYLFKWMLNDFDEEREDFGFSHETDGKSADLVVDDISCPYTHLAFWLASILRFLQAQGIVFSTISDLRSIYDRFIDEVIRLIQSDQIEQAIVENEKWFEPVISERMPFLRLLVTKIIFSAYGHSILIADDHPFKATDRLKPNQYFSQITSCGQLRAIAKQLENCAHLQVMYGIDGLNEFWVYRDGKETALLRIDIRDPPYRKTVVEFSTTRNKSPSRKAKRRLTLWLKNQQVHIW